MSRMTETIEAVRTAIDANLVPILWGADGEGKTSFIRSEIARRKWGGWIVNGSNMDPTDIGGAISVDDSGVASRVPVHRAIREALEYSARGEHYLIFIDEVTCSPGAVLATLLTLLSEHIAGDVELDPNLVRFVIAANPPDIAVNATDLAPPVCTRMVHFDWQLDFDFWCDGMVSGRWAPAEQAALCVGFLRRQGETSSDTISANSTGGAFRVAPTREYLNKPRPTPRSWTNLAKALSAAQGNGASRHAIRLIAEGTIGQRIGSEFMGYYTLREHIPEPSEILANPSDTEIPVRSDIAFMFYQSIAAYVSGTKKMNDWKAAWVVIGRSDGTPHKDKAMIAAQTLAKLMQTPEGKHLRKHIPSEARIFGEMFKDLGLLKKDQ